VGTAAPERWLRFRVGADLLAVALESVVEVCEVRAAHPIPFVAPEIGGVQNVRGEPLPTVDGARLLLGTAGGGGGVLLVLEEEGLRVGIRVDAASTFEPGEPVELEPEEPARGRALRRFARAGGARIGLCDATELVERARRLLCRRGAGEWNEPTEGGDACPHGS
jgi:purine-binding chemotaxis protein CheW